MPSLDEASIFGALARMATPMPDFARSTRVAATSLPSLISWSISAAGRNKRSGVSAPLASVVDAAPDDRDLVPGCFFEPRHKTGGNLPDAGRADHLDLGGIGHSRQ